MHAASKRRHPPAFRVVVGRQLRLQALLVALVLLSSSAALAGVAAHEPKLWWLFLLFPLIAALAWRAAAVAPSHLQWDGQTWRLARPELSDVGVPVEIEVVMDLGAWLLLRARLPGSRWPRHRYLPLSRQPLGAAWGLLRATLYSARPEPSERARPLA